MIRTDQNTKRFRRLSSDDASVGSSDSYPSTSDDATDKSDVPDVGLDRMPFGRHSQYTSTGPIRNLPSATTPFRYNLGHTIGETDM